MLAIPKPNFGVEKILYTHLVTCCIQSGNTLCLGVKKRVGLGWWVAVILLFDC